VSLGTPESVRTLQKALHEKAKQAPGYRFFSLYDKVFRKDVLAWAYRCCHRNDGTAGVDGQSFTDIQAFGLQAWLEALAEELQCHTYRPQPIRRVWIPKPNGGQRPLGIPTIRDRVVQMAVVLVLQPILEADLLPEQYAYRPGRSAHDAVKRVNELLRTGHTQVVDADVSGYFDTIPHTELMKSLARRISDGSLLALIKMWLVAPVEETDAKGQKRRTTRSRKEKRGIPQGAPLSPLLSNLYMRRLLLGWKAFGHQQRWQAHIVNYADDFVVCCRRNANEALVAIQGMMHQLKLALSETKTRVCLSQHESFDFLGFTFGRYHSPVTGRTHFNQWPSRRKVSRICREISECTSRRWFRADIADQVKKLNRLLWGWRNYFALGAFWKSFKAVDHHAVRRLRRWLCGKHKIRGTGGKQFPLTYLYDVLGLVRLEAVAPRHSAARANS